MIKTFQDIGVWQKAHELTLSVYKFTRKYPREETFGLVSQIRRCTVSIGSNIAEGYRRRTSKDRMNFYNIAEGSLEELEYQLILSRDLSYISLEEYNFLFPRAEEVGKMLCSWKKGVKDVF